MNVRRFQTTLLLCGLAAFVLCGCGPSESHVSVSSQPAETPAEFFEMRDDEGIGQWSARTRAITAHWKDDWTQVVQGMSGPTEPFVGMLVQASGELVQREPGRWGVTTFSGVECVVLLPGEEPDIPVAQSETPIVTFAGMVQSIDGEGNRVTVYDCMVMSVVSKSRWDELQAGTTGQ